MAEIVIIEDDPELGSLIRGFLLNAGYSAHIAGSGERGLKYISENAADLVLLDVMLPGMNGFETCAELRKVRDIPILMMSAVTDEQSKLKGYGSGADDYIDKPFSVNILLAKIKALLKRSGTDEDDTFSSDGITLSIGARTVFKNGKQLKLNAKEFELLCMLMKNKGSVMTKEQLFNAVWGTGCFTELSTVSVHIRWLREKLEDDPTKPKLIRTVYKIGYRFGDEG